MIAFLHGQIVESDEGVVVLSVRGVGYEVFVSDFTRQELIGKPSVQLLIYTHVREDLIQLYGFHVKAEKQLFISLIKVNGIGPKVAMKILSGAPLGRIISSIDAGDVKALSQLPKVGKKTAEQIILDLKGKFVSANEVQSHSPFLARADIVSALANLGFKLQDVEKVVDEMDTATEFEDGIKKGLSQLAGQF